MLVGLPLELQASVLSKNGSLVKLLTRFSTLNLRSSGYVFYSAFLV